MEIGWPAVVNDNFSLSRREVWLTDTADHPE